MNGVAGLIMTYISIVTIPLLVGCFATSRSSSVDLAVSDRGLILKTQVKRDIGQPKEIGYTDQGSAGVAMGAGLAFGLVGAVVAAPIVANMKKDERAMIHGVLGERADRDQPSYAFRPR